MVDFNNKYVITQEGLTNLWNKHISILGAENSTIIESVSNISDNMYIFRGRGYGHGVGMSQWGAKAMAENGYNYKQILLHYYKNVEILQSNL